MMAATSKNIDLAWRLTFLLPLAMHLVTSLVVLSGRDLPDGQFKELEQSGAKQKGDGSIVLKVCIFFFVLSQSLTRQAGTFNVRCGAFRAAAICFDVCGRVATSCGRIEYL